MNFPSTASSTLGTEGRGKVVAGYSLQQRLGSGSFATVFKGVKVSSSAKGASCVAIKAISRTNDKLTKKVLQNLEIEISILRSYRHRNIVCLQDVQKTERHIYLLLEYCSGGDLQNLIRSRKDGRLTERLTRRLMRDLSAGLKFLWGQELIHRDIKPQNLLLTGPLPLDELNDPEKSEALEAQRRESNFPSEQFALKIADFGFARHLQSASLAETLCGSPLYMAPEILQHHRYDAKADLWSVGTVLFEMLAGRPPFNGENHIDLLRNIQRKAVHLPAQVRVSREGVTLLRLLLNRNPLSRAGFKEFFDACEAFVSLGCEGVATIDPGTCCRDTLKDLGTIDENIDDSRKQAETNQSIPTESKEHQPEERQVDATSTSYQIKSQTQQPPREQIKKSTSKNTGSPSQLVPAKTYKGYSRLAPLEPSPPSAAQLDVTPSHLPALPSLKGQGREGYGRQHVTFQRPSSNEKGHLGYHNEIGVLEKSDDGSGFVLVEHTLSDAPGAQKAAIVSYSKENARFRPPDGQTKLVASPPSSSSPKYFLTKNPSISNGDVVERRGKGILSTSPGTACVLLGMIGGKRIGCEPPSGGFQKSQDESKSEAAAKLLAASEDVGRRAVSVAHVGDTRAYLALRLNLLGEGNSSILSGHALAEEELEHDEENMAVQTDSCSTQTMSQQKSDLTDKAMPDVKEEVEDDEEMPFAVRLEEPSNLAAGMPSRSSSSLYRKKPVVKPVAKPSPMMLQSHFREALSCYLKALKMLKSSVMAAQKVKRDLDLIVMNGNLSTEHTSHLNKLMKRCDVTSNWLSGQFKGVLERGDAANVEIMKLSSQLKSQESDACPVIPVEELIFQHALACGREGAVKQLLGQYEAARSCYRSAGLVAESLLMESSIEPEDRKTLEGYVDGFAARITELDDAILKQSRSATSSIGNLSTGFRRGSGLIGNFGHMQGMNASPC